MNATAVLLDNDVLIDYLTDREPFTATAKAVIKKCYIDNIPMYLSAHSILNTFYILRKIYSVEERKNRLLDLCAIVDVVGIEPHAIHTILVDFGFADIEDCLQAECAKEISADYIITRNIRHYAASPVPPILPEEFLRIIDVS